MKKGEGEVGIKQKIYEDYFKKSRLTYYQKVLAKAKDKGYQMVGIRAFYNKIKMGISEREKFLINRHDIDTSPKVARKMFNIELEVYGCEGSSTYYFRNSTIDYQLISDIEEKGYETGYHYEEIATFEAEEVYDQADAGGFINCFGLPMKVVAQMKKKNGLL